MDPRTLERDHRRLAAILRPGMRVLDVGCGAGGITAGIARAVGPAGSVLGIDTSREAVEAARQAYGNLPNLAFELQDALALDRAQFDVATAARTLQWIEQPQKALDNMARAARVVLALDYNHLHVEWEPSPPPPFRAFYDAFLGWRAANGWDNEITEHLPAMFERAGLTAIEVFVEDETAEDSEASRLWLEVVSVFGPKLMAGGVLAADQVAAAARACAGWPLRRHTIEARAVQGRGRVPWTAPQASA